MASRNLRGRLDRLHRTVPDSACGIATQNADGTVSHRGRTYASLDHLPQASPGRGYLLTPAQVDMPTWERAAKIVFEAQDAAYRLRLGLSHGEAAT